MSNKKIINTSVVPMLYLKTKMPCNYLNYKAFFAFSADWTGLEPATSAVTGQHSNQLNYQSCNPANTSKIKN